MKFDEKVQNRPPLKRGLSTKSHSLFEVEDKAAEEMVLTARKHLFLSNNLYSVSNHLREIIEKGDDSATAKVNVDRLLLAHLRHTLFCVDAVRIIRSCNFANSFMFW